MMQLYNQFCKRVEDKFVQLGHPEKNKDKNKQWQNIPIWEEVNIKPLFDVLLSDTAFCTRAQLQKQILFI